MVVASYGRSNSGARICQSCWVSLEKWQQGLPEEIFEGLGSGAKRLERFLGCVSDGRGVWCRVARRQMIASLRALTDPEDALQDACLSAWRRSESISMTRLSEFVPWVKIVLQRALITR